MCEFFSDVQVSHYLMICVICIFKLCCRDAYLRPRCLPVLGNVETPLKLEMLLLIVVNEARDGVVVASSEHAARSLLLLD